MYCKKCGKQLRDDASFCPNCGTSLSVPQLDILTVFRTGIPKASVISSNGSDLFVYPHLPENVKNSIRTNFHLDYDDKIFFIRDTSWWDTRNQGLVITDKGIVCIPDNDKANEIVLFYWADIDRVEYQDLVLHFWNNEGYSYPIHISYFIKGDENENGRYIGEALAAVFTQMASVAIPVKSLLEETMVKIDDLMASKKCDEALQLALSFKEKEGDNSALDFYIAGIYAEKKEYRKTIQFCERGLECVDEENCDLVSLLLYQKYSACHELGDDFTARKDCLTVMRNTSATLVCGDGISVRDDAEKDFRQYEQNYIHNFLSMPYNKRKLIVPVNEYIDLSQQLISVVDIRNLPAINFPIGHPIANQLYVGHPFIADQYILFEDHELTFIDDRVREFCLIMQFLGATEVSVESINGKNVNEEIKEDLTIKGGSSYRIAKAQGAYHKESENRLVNSIKQTIGLTQKYTPSKSLALPDGLVWYPYEASWQRLYQQRMQGSLLEHREKIETRKNRVLQSSELRQVEGEFKSLVLTAHATWDNHLEASFETQEDADLTIYVRFAPLSALTGNNENVKCNNLLSLSLTADEQEYLDEYRECLEEGNDISPKERRLLDRLREKLGISEKRSVELENSLKPQLSEVEQEYLEEYRICLEEDGEISDRERRLLDRLRDKLGITQERANELEKY